MGNEMGNNNTSGFQEEDNTNPEAQQKSAQEPVHTNDVKGENHVIPTTGSKDYYKKETGLTSDDPNQASDGTGQEETEVNPHIESQKTDKKLSEKGGEDSDIQSAVSLLNELEDHKNPSENVLEMSDNQTDKQSFFFKEKEDMLNSTSVAISSTNDTESQDSTEPKSDQHEFTKVHTDQSEGYSTNSLRGTEDALGSSIAFNSKENGHLNLEGPLVSNTNLDMGVKSEDMSMTEIASQEDEVPSKEKFEVEAGNEDVGERDDGEFASKIHCNGTISLESQLEANQVADSLTSHLEVSVPEEKCMILPQETILIGNESEKEENEIDNHKPARASKIDMVNGSQTDSLTRPNCNNNEMEDSLITVHDAASNGSCHIEEVKIVEESDNQNEASEEHYEGSEEKIMMACELGGFVAESSIANGKNNEEESGYYRPEAYAADAAASNGNCQVEESDNQNTASEEHCEGSEEKIMMACELGGFVAESYIANGKSNEEESGDCTPEAYTAAASNENCQVEEFDNQNIASEEPCDVFGVIAVESSIANGKNNEEESGDCKLPEACEGKVWMIPEPVTVAEELAVTKATNNEEEMEDCKAEEEELAEKLIVEIKEKIEAPCAPASIFQSEDHQQKTVMKSEEAQGNNESTLESNPESSSEFFAATASNFHATSSPVETCVSAIELEIEKPVEEVLPIATVGPEMETEANFSASANHSSEQPEKFEISVFARNGIDAQENAEKLSTEPIPENLIQEKVQNSPSSIIESIVSVVHLGIQKPQKEAPHYNTAVPEMLTEAKLSASTNQSTEQCEKAESVGRLSTESIPDGLNIHAEMRKSPSFNLDLRIEARNEESDKTPLLYQDKNTIEGLSSQANVSRQNSLLHSQYSQESLKYQEMTVEEKVITLERSDSEKSRTPFLGFLKEDQEPHRLVVISKKQDKHSSAKKATKEITPKSKEKHKRRSSLFTNCMCCTTVIN